MPAFTPQPQSITALRPVPTDTAWWQRHIGVKNLPSFYAMWPAETQTHDLLIASPMLYWQRHYATVTRICTCCLITEVLVVFKMVVHQLLEQTSCFRGESSHGLSSTGSRCWNEKAYRWCYGACRCKAEFSIHLVASLRSVLFCYLRIS